MPEMTELDAVARFLIGRELTAIDDRDGNAVLHFGDRHRLVIHKGPAPVQGHLEVDYDEGESGPWDRDPPEHVTGGA